MFIRIGRGGRGAGATLWGAVVSTAQLSLVYSASPLPYLNPASRAALESRLT